MKTKCPFLILAGLATLLFFSNSHAEETPSSAGHCIQFNDVPIIEFIRYVSRISEENFIFDARELDFPISLSTGKSVSTEMVMQALVQLLKVHGFETEFRSGYYVIHKQTDPLSIEAEELLASSEEKIPIVEGEAYEFFVYKLQYHEGPEIEESLKKIAVDLRSQSDAPLKLINAIQSLQWVKATNSLLFSADPVTLEKLNQLIISLDSPLRQVFIEVLVIETDVKKGLDFGLQWAAGGQYGSKLGFGAGAIAPHSPFGSTMQGINATNTPTGLNQVPLLPGFDLGVIGDVITHRGTSYFSLGSLVSALQMDRSSTIVLNQKIITQDNKNSTIFVGDNIPFTGSVVQTVGQSQQTTANIEYRDIGVSLSITPRLGEGDIITLQLNEEITESLDHDVMNNNSQVNGIRTTKTNMATHVHVPDKHFLVLSGMIRNTKVHQKTGIPCLGGLPIIGAAFSKTHQNDEKRNVIIFVRPHIIQSFQDYQKVSDAQEAVYRSQTNSEADFNAGLNLVEHD
jgi:type III secretion protein C